MRDSNLLKENPQNALSVGIPSYTPNQYSSANQNFPNNNFPPNNHQNNPSNNDLYLAREVSIEKESGLKCKDKARAIFYVLLNTSQIILISVSLSLNWMNYCYWNFSLYKKHKIIGNGRDYGDNTDKIDGFYDDICGNGDLFPECPDLCDGVDKLRGSGDIVLGLYIPSIILYFIVTIVYLVGVKKIYSKRFKVVLILFNFLPFLLFLSGFIAYYRVVDPDNNFQETKRKEIKSGPKPDNFGWNGGLYLHIPVFIVEFLRILLVYELIYKFRSY